jgi:hypothetical protein
MRKHLTKKTALLAAALAIAITAVAVAYLSSAGTGTGTGATSEATGTVTLAGTTPDITQIGDTQTMTITGTNNGSSPTKVAGISVGAITLPAGCPSGSFEFGTPSTTGTEIAPGATETVGSVSVTFVNNDAVQDACLSGFSVALSSN